MLSGVMTADDEEACFFAACRTNKAAPQGCTSSQVLTMSLQKCENAKGQRLKRRARAASARVGVCICAPQGGDDGQCAVNGW